MNYIFALFILAACLSSAWQQYTYQMIESSPAPLLALTQGITQSAQEAVTFSFQLIGQMCFFLGIMKLAEASGILSVLNRALYPLLKRLFPEVPEQHPAMGAMVMNLSANVLGLGNAATPFGIKAMQSLATLNATPHIASRSMILFLALNSSSVTLMPTGIIALRAAAGSIDPACVLPTIWIATSCSTIVAILSCYFFQSLDRHREPAPLHPHPLPPTKENKPSSRYRVLKNTLSGLLIVGLLIVAAFSLKNWSVALIPGLIFSVILAALIRKVPVYEQFVEGAKEGVETALRLIPYLVAIFTLLGMLKSSGVLTWAIEGLTPWTAYLGMPSEVLPLVLMRPLSGSGSFGLLGALLQDPNIGPDSYIGLLASTLQGSTETTLYVLTVYFGAAKVVKFRYALWAGLSADLAGFLASSWAVAWYFG